MTDRVKTVVNYSNQLYDLAFGSSDEDDFVNIPSKKSKGHAEKTTKKLKNPEKTLKNSKEKGTKSNSKRSQETDNAQSKDCNVKPKRKKISVIDLDQDKTVESINDENTSSDITSNSLNDTETYTTQKPENNCASTYTTELNTIISTADDDHRVKDGSTESSKDHRHSSESENKRYDDVTTDPTKNEVENSEIAEPEKKVSEDDDQNSDGTAQTNSKSVSSKLKTKMLKNPHIDTKKLTADENELPKSVGSLKVKVNVPKWTPPAKLGTPRIERSNSSTPASGIRMGLSRIHRGPSLHPNFRDISSK